MKNLPLKALDETNDNPYIEYRLDVLRRLKQKLRQNGHSDVSTSHDKKQLITDHMFYQEFSIKMRLLKEIQDEEDRRQKR